VVEQIQPGWVELFSTKNVSNKIPSGRSNWLSRHVVYNSNVDRQFLRILLLILLQEVHHIQLSFHVHPLRVVELQPTEGSRITGLLRRQYNTAESHTHRTSSPSLTQDCLKQLLSNHLARVYSKRPVTCWTCSFWRSSVCFRRPLHHVFKLCNKAFLRHETRLTRPQSYRQFTKTSHLFFLLHSDFLGSGHLAVIGTLHSMPCTPCKGSCTLELYLILESWHRCPGIQEKLNSMLLMSHKGWSSIYARTGEAYLPCIMRTFAIICCHSASVDDFKPWRCDNIIS
jgi:hypothetical protein